MVKRHACDCGVPQVWCHHFAMCNRQKNMSASMQELISLEKVEFKRVLRTPLWKINDLRAKLATITSVFKQKVKHKLKHRLEKEQDEKHQQFYKQIH